MNFMAHYKLSELTVIVVCRSNSNTENILTDIFHSWGEQVSHLCGTAQGFYSLIVPHMETVPHTSISDAFFWNLHVFSSKTARKFGTAVVT